eukprot:7715946-Pyramimonas_sp.AAC.1
MPSGKRAGAGLALPALSPANNANIRWGRWLRTAPRMLQTLEGSLSDGGGGGIHGRDSVGVPPASRPWIP